MDPNAVTHRTRGRIEGNERQALLLAKVVQKTKRELGQKLDKKGQMQSSNQDI